MTGDELAHDLRRAAPDCKVLYFTGFSDELFAANEALGDCEAFIDKPASPNALLEAAPLLLYGHLRGPLASSSDAEQH